MVMKKGKISYPREMVTALGSEFQMSAMALVDAGKRKVDEFGGLCSHVKCREGIADWG